MPKTVIGILSYNDLHYLKKTLPALNDIPDSQTVILDNAHNDEVRDFIEKNYKEIEYLRHPDGNLGFGRGHNYILLKSPQSDYYFCLNNDILLEAGTFEKCIKKLDSDHDLCMVSAKLYYWDFDSDNKTNIIDTLGIAGNRAHHFWDRGQGKIDKGRFDYSINNIFGISGAAFIIRRNCIPELHGSSNMLFDENFFMYKEDIDLGYRMRWRNLKMELLPCVLGYHHRTVSKSKKKSPFEAKQSYKNHLILLRNNFTLRLPFSFIYQTLVYEFLKALYYLFRNPKVLKEFKSAFNIKLHKSTKKIPPGKMAKYFLK